VIFEEIGFLYLFEILYFDYEIVDTFLTIYQYVDGKVEFVVGNNSVSNVVDGSSKLLSLH